MTTFTTEDRIIAEKDGSLTVNVNGGSVTSSPPHIVDSGASVMIKGLTDQELVALWARVQFLEKECKALQEQANGV
jgi:hypothetical protein